MSLRVANLEDLVKRATKLAELATEASDPVVQQEGHDLLRRITVHDAIHGGK